MTDAANSGANSGAEAGMTGNPQNAQNTQGTTGGQMSAGGPSGQSAAESTAESTAGSEGVTQQSEASVAEELGWAQGESPAGAAGGAQPNAQGADQPTATFPRRNPEPGNADDPVGTNLIPPVSTGERRWVDAQVGALDENQYTNPEYAGIQGDMMGSNPTIQGAPFEQGLPPGQDDLTPGNEGFIEGGNEGPPTEAYGQGETRQFAPLGAEPGIEQQEVLQSQQYEREERRSQQGILGTVGNMLGALFGNAKRTPVPPPPGEDEGEAAGEAHP